MVSDTRPPISAITDPAIFTDWYWLKAELTEHCRAIGLSTQGSKAELTDRIAHFLATGERSAPGTVSVNMEGGILCSRLLKITNSSMWNLYRYKF